MKSTKLTIIKYSSLFIFLLFSVKGIACSCQAVQSFCELSNGEVEWSVVRVVVNRENPYHPTDTVAYITYYDAEIIDHLFGPELEVDSFTFRSSHPDCEYTIGEVKDTIILKIFEFMIDSVFEHPTTYMLSPCFNNFLVYEDEMVIGNIYHSNSGNRNPWDTIAYVDFLDWYPDCALSSAAGKVEPFAEVSIFPNPTSDNINLKNRSSEMLVFSLINSIGQTIISGSLQANSIKEVNLRGFSNGVYYLRFEDGTRQKSQKILKL